MSKKKTKLMILYAIGISSMVIGLIVYLLFRENTYISEFIGAFIPLNSFRKAFSFAECDFLKFWFTDFLWAIGFSAWLHIALSPGFRGTVFCFFAVSSTGIIFELLQYIDVISGTADLLDIMAYISAGVLMSIIYLF